MANEKNLENGKATQFAAGDSRKRGGEKAWSIRGQIRYIAAQNIDITKPDALQELFGEKPTNAQRAAFNAVLKACQQDADIKAIEFTDDRIDGKLPQTTINADWENLKKLDDDELLSIITHGFTEITVVGGGGAGSEAPGAEGATAENSDATGSSASVSGTMGTETT